MSARQSEPCSSAWSRRAATAVRWVSSASITTSLPATPRRMRPVSRSAIEVVDLQREFGGGVKAVAGIDLAVAPGEVYGFLGPNGAGKTTTVRMLVTLLRPTGGRATIAGFDVASEPAAVRRRIGVALQEAALDGLMTARELVELQATLH